MSWNYRVVAHRGELEDVYLIHEVYYGKRGAIQGWSENGMAPLGTSLKELRVDMRYLAQALRQPVLEVKDGKLKKAKGGK